MGKSVLDPVEHARLLADLPHFAAVANIPEAYVHASATAYCSKAEIEWLKRIKTHVADGKFGAVMGSGEKSVETRMFAMIGACLRNYIDAQFHTVQGLLASMKAGTLVKPTVLFIPNFYLSKSDGGDIASWERSKLWDMLYERQAAGLLTVVYVSDMQKLAVDYGQMVADYLNANFEVIS